MQKKQFCVVLVTVPNTKVAQNLAKGLVREKLAACVNVIANITSHYYWNNKLQKDQEILLVIKTQMKFFKKLAGFIKKNHSYKVPEIISLPILQGDKAYLGWIKANTR